MSSPVEPITLEVHTSGHILTIEDRLFYFRKFLFPLVCFTTLSLLQFLSFANILFIAFLYFTFPSIVRLRYPTFGKPGGLDELKINIGTILGLFASSTALFLQIDHVDISIAIKRHSDFHLRPLSRLLRAILLVELALGGMPMEKEQTGYWLRYLNQNIQGSVTPQMRKELGLPSSATDYRYSHELKAYVLQTLVWSTISFLERFDRKLSKRAKDVIVLEFTCIGLRFDVPPDFLPRDYDSFLASFHQRLDHFSDNERYNLTCETIRDIEDGILNAKMNWIASFLLRSSLIIGHDLLPEQVKERHELKLLDSKWKRLWQKLMITTLWIIYPSLPYLPLRGLLSLLLLLEPELKSTFCCSLNAVHSMDILADTPSHTSQQFVNLLLDTSAISSNTNSLHISWLGIPSCRDFRTSALQTLLFRTLETQVSSNRLSAWFFYPLSLCFALLQGWWHDGVDVLLNYRSEFVKSGMFYSGGKYNTKLSLPYHVGLVLDGNRRFARRRRQRIIQGHAKGAATGISLIEWWLNCNPNTDHSVQPNRPRYLTCWIFSSENFSRSPGELEALFRLLVFEFKSIAHSSLIHLFRVRVNVIGGEKELARLPVELKEAIKILEELTREFEDYVLTFAVGYGGRREIIDCVQSIIDRNEEVSEASISSKTYCARRGIPPVDLIIRTSEQRTSGFFLWDTQLAELHFVDKIWPEFTELDWRKSLQSFSRREIRRGK